MLQSNNRLQQVVKQLLTSRQESRKAAANRMLVSIKQASTMRAADLQVGPMGLKQQSLYTRSFSVSDHAILAFVCRICKALGVQLCRYQKLMVLASLWMTAGPSTAA